jgi:diguanylate cyclase (GGDEF)-like protein
VFSSDTEPLIFASTRTLLWLAAACGLAAMSGVIVATSLTSSLVEDQMHYNAALVSQVVHEARLLYSSEAVGRVRGVSGVTVSNRYQTVPGAIPNPATFTILLGERLSAMGTVVHMYSDLPFKNRHGGPRDEFGVAALAHANRDPETPLIEYEVKDNMEVMRYAGAMLMEASCVDCHNTHPDSPKRGWKVGDVRGVLEVTQPYSAPLAAVRGAKETRVLLFAVAVLIVFASIFMLVRARRLRRGVELEISRRTADLTVQAETDPLTGIANRRVFDVALERRWATALQGESGLSVILIDVDHFKAYNDHYGHPTGDECLRSVASAMRMCLQRPGDVLTRYGGEEFALLLHGSDSSGVVHVAERLRAAVEFLQVPHEHSTASSVVTVSVGCAALSDGQYADALKLVAAADTALYQAKADGRNRVAMAG